MSLSSINLLVDELSKQYINAFLLNQFDIYLEDNKTLSKAAIQAFEHKGLYAFILTKENKTGIVYVGKSEEDNRLRQHLTGKNKDDTLLASSVKTKYKDIEEAIKNNFTVRLALIEDEQFKKSSLGCLETECILKSTIKLNESQLNIKSWNKRVG